MVEVVDQVVPLKRKRYNKNKKKAWRKKTDISEVEDTLEEERREERYGGPLEEREDKELLFLDTGVDSSTTKTHVKDEEFSFEYTVDKIPEDAGGSGSSNKVQLKPSSRKRRVKTLKSHQFLNGLQGAKTPHKLQGKRDTMSVAMKRKAQVQAKDPKVTKRFQQRIKQIEDSKVKENEIYKNVKKNKYKFDLWAEGADNVSQECKKKGVEESFIKGISDYYRTERKIRPVKVPKHRYDKVSRLKAVEIPKGGTSYNPHDDDHQKLMQEAISQEETRRRKLKKVDRATIDMFPTIDKAPSEASWLEEMSQGLPKAGDEDEEENEEQEEEGDEEQVTVTNRPKIERKTKKQRRKEQKQKAIQLKRLREKEERIRSSNVFRVKTYQKEIENLDDLTHQRNVSRLAYQKQRKFTTLRLGKMRFEEEDVTVSLGDELPDCLRHVKPAVDLLEERFKNLQRRNLIEPRLPTKMVRKYKLKKTMKGTYKKALEEIEKIEYD
ncbi:ribosome biogenesis protein NOP53-like [Homarus americanus]|uniref:Ribosome biogenesis protein NOP53 n=1 Tax=Homarus americanus TaxID=6706 RepID=A0A8J5MNA5_HOMAM|nr:ribosome biogenesis protein NOP53-like [Homarus americanus]KAG7157808.1 Ribosome biogenesis protein NOP53-like [Homarus americanus]